ncbi:MAG: hypothetical protein LN417_05920 [Candidatus Thermoplasmatota archaeon]|nr:hypothetical protein [Candidatus Thermoplasmatota archaeon]
MRQEEWERLSEKEKLRVFATLDPPPYLWREHWTPEERAERTRIYRVGFQEGRASARHAYIMADDGVLIHSAQCWCENNKVFETEPLRHKTIYWKHIEDVEA